MRSECGIIGSHENVVLGEEMHMPRDLSTCSYLICYQSRLGGDWMYANQTGPVLRIVCIFIVPMLQNHVFSVQLHVKSTLQSLYYAIFGVHRNG